VAADAAAGPLVGIRVLDLTERMGALAHSASTEQLQRIDISALFPI
jgi:hypothetical protein